LDLKKGWPSVQSTEFELEAMRVRSLGDLVRFGHEKGGTVRMVEQEANHMPVWSLLPFHAIGRLVCPGKATIRHLGSLA